MPRIRPRSATYDSTPRRKAPRYERKGHFVQEGEPRGSLKALLEERPDADKELDRLEEGRAESAAFIRAMTEGEE